MREQIVALASEIEGAMFDVPAVENGERLMPPVVGSGYIVTQDRSGTTLHLTVSEAHGMSWAVNGKEASRVEDVAVLLPMIEGKLRLMEWRSLRHCRFHTAATCAAMIRNIRAEGCVR
jgi:hypothetical protein